MKEVIESYYYVFAATFSLDTIKGMQEWLS